MNLQILQMINKHPHLLNFYGCCYHRNKVYTVVQRAVLGNLHEHLIQIQESRGSLNLNISLEVAAQINGATLYLHDTVGVLHRNLAARNVLLFSFSDSNPRDVLVKLTDFEISLAPSSNRFATRWSSPEILLRRHFSMESDVWAYGVVLWEIFTCGVLPYFEISSDEQVGQAIVTGKRLGCPKNCPEAIFQQMMVHCWAGPSHRPTCAALITSLQEVVNHLSQDACVICLERGKEVAIAPCGHLCLCQSCSESLSQPSSSCPVCRSPVQSLLRIYSYC